MKRLKQIWQYAFMEPFTWIFYCFFQPVRFRREFEVPGYFKLKRLLPMLRVTLPLFFCSYLCTIVSFLIVEYPHSPFFASFSAFVNFVLISYAERLFIGIAVFGIAGGFILGIGRGIIFSIICGLMYILEPFPGVLNFPTISILQFIIFGSLFFGMAFIDFVDSNIYQPLVVSIVWSSGAILIYLISVVLGWNS